MVINRLATKLTYRRARLQQCLCRNSAQRHNDRRWAPARSKAIGSRSYLASVLLAPAAEQQTAAPGKLERSTARSRSFALDHLPIDDHLDSLCR